MENWKRTRRVRVEIGRKLPYLTGAPAPNRGTGGRCGMGRQPARDGPATALGRVVSGRSPAGHRPAAGRPPAGHRPAADRPPAGRRPTNRSPASCRPAGPAAGRRPAGGRPSRRRPAGGRSEIGPPSAGRRCAMGPPPARRPSKVFDPFRQIASVGYPAVPKRGGTSNNMPLGLPGEPSHAAWRPRQPPPCPNRPG